MDADAPDWRRKLLVVDEILSDIETSAPDNTELPDMLACLGAYLDLVSTGRIPCAEGGGHFRPNRHATVSESIFERLVGMQDGSNALARRRIVRSLPSFGTEYRRSEPLTRIRDIAHRNDIPPDLKREIKTTLQNKLHRSAGPEDLLTSASLLKRITTAPPGTYPESFVDEFSMFHDELIGFFNATGLAERLVTARDALSSNMDISASIDRLRIGRMHPRDELSRLTALRRALHANACGGHDGYLMLTLDIALEERAYTLSSELINSLDTSDMPDALGLLSLLVENISLTSEEPGECDAISRESLACAALARRAGNQRDTRLRALASCRRAARLAERGAGMLYAACSKSPQQLAYHFLPRSDAALLPEDTVRESLYFTLSRLCAILGAALRSELAMAGWQAICAGRVSGRLVMVSSLHEAAGLDGEVICAIDHAYGDEHIPANVRGILLGSAIPHLCHLGLRARQAGVAIACAETSSDMNSALRFVEQHVTVNISQDTFSIAPSNTSGISAAPRSAAPRKPAILPSEHCPPLPLGLRDAKPATCGMKAYNTRKLVELSGRLGFGTPAACALPFSAFEEMLSLNPSMAERLRAACLAPRAEIGKHLEELRAAISRMQISPDIIDAIVSRFPAGARLAVRSSCNAEDLAGYAGAGLFDSMLNAATSTLGASIAKVWSSLYNDRAVLAALELGIDPHDLRMAVLMQEMVVPDYAFISHTRSPLGNDSVYIELCQGLGETLASAGSPGSAYRMSVSRDNERVEMLAFPDIGTALLPDMEGDGLLEHTADYSLCRLVNDRGFREMIARRIAAIALGLESVFGSPQDIEGALTGEDVYILQTRPQTGIES